MLKLKYASFATVNQLFKFKSSGFKLEPFPGYTEDQWGIKAHNRPWIESVGEFKPQQKIIEVGGAYSLLPLYIAKKYNLEAWIGDDFGEHSNKKLWTRWGDPKDLPLKYPEIKYVFEPFGNFSDSYPSNYFDRIFSVSTLEHIPVEFRLNVFKDMNRCMAPGGIQIHTIDIRIPKLREKGIYSILGDRFKFLNRLSKAFMSEINDWISVMKASGITIEAIVPSSVHLYDRATLVESPDVVYRFYSPLDSPKNYQPTASLLLIVKKD